MKLRKPPVVEVSISFHFEASPTEPEWDLERAVGSIGHDDNYPEVEVSQQELIELHKVSRGKKSAILTKQKPLAVRAFPRDRSRYVVNAPDELRCVFARTVENDYPGFDALKCESLAKLKAYDAYFRPAKLLRFVLRYVDLFRIPLTDARAALSDYFTICQEPNEATFGTTFQFRKQFATRPEGSEDVLTCDLYNVPKGKDQSIPGIPFRMEWGMHAAIDLPLHGETLEDRLRQAHDHLLRCFRGSFTAAGWALFEPENSN
jgi:uncharacterized protein (TIGR04255 family)